MSVPESAFDDLPVVEMLPRGRVPAAPSVYDARCRPTRREMLGFGLKAGVFVGLAMLGLFKSVRRAEAEFPYQAYSSCGQYDPDYWNGFDGDDNGFFEPGTCDDDVCIGAPDDAMGSWYCTTCEEVGPHNPYGWHFTGPRGPFLYGDATDLCRIDGATSSARDAWKWHVSSCLECEPAVFRCHDGWKLDPVGEVTATVCQGLVECSGSLYQPC
jgi:hypothetical protein